MELTFLKQMTDQSSSLLNEQILLVIGKSPAKGKPALGGVTEGSLQISQDITKMPGQCFESGERKLTAKYRDKVTEWTAS